MNDEPLITFLMSFPGITAEFATRIYPGGLLPQRKGAVTDALPAVTVKTVSDVGDHSMSGVRCWHKTRYQLDVWAATILEAQRTARVLTTVLDGYRGEMSGHTVGGAFRKSSFSQYQEDVQLWRVISDYEIHFLN